MTAGERRWDTAPTAEPHRLCKASLSSGRRAIYDNTLFRFEGHPVAGWLHGRLACPHIDQLADDHDHAAETGRAPPDNNPLPTFSRRRRGPPKDHPSCMAVGEAVEEQPAPLIRKNRSRKSSPATNRENPRRRVDCRIISEGPHPECSAKGLPMPRWASLSTPAQGDSLVHAGVRPRGHSLFDPGRGSGHLSSAGRTTGQWRQGARG